MTSRRLSLQKPGYESVELDASPNFAIDPPLQRIARLTTGSSTALTLAPNDMEYVDTAAGVVCQPCRLIRIPIPAAGKLRITVQWDDADAAVNLWTGGQVFTGRDVAREVSADLTVVPGELIVYVGRRLGSVELSGHASMTMLVSDVSEMAVAARISRMFVREAVCDRY
jgi:hypothetical protein